MTISNRSEFGLFQMIVEQDTEIPKSGLCDPTSTEEGLETLRSHIGPTRHVG